MQTDKTYTPLRNDFDQLLVKAFSSDLTEEQRKTLRMVFMAGATSAYAYLRDHPDQAETLFDELVDKVERWGTPQTTKVA